MSTIPPPSPTAREQFTLALFEHARATGHISPITGTRRVVLSPHLRILSIITSPADHAGVWGMAEGKAGTAPKHHIAADTHNMDDVLKQWDSLGRSWVIWAKQAHEEGELAQLLVANRTALEKLHYAARRVVSHPKASEYAQHAANHIITATHYTRAPGAQTIICAADLLREHFTTGSDTADEIHLGHWVNYPEHPAGWDGEQTGLDPDFEAEKARFGQAADRMFNAEGNTRFAKAARIPTLLKPVLTERFKTLETALNIYGEHPGAVLSAAENFYVRQAAATNRFYQNNSRPSMNSIPARVATLAERENAAQMWQGALWAEDNIERAYAVMSGDVIAGVCAGGVVSTVPGRVVRARAGDTFCDRAGNTATVIEMQATAEGGTNIMFEGELEAGDILLHPAAPASIPPRWVNPNWVHSKETPAPVGAPPSAPEGMSLTEYAESLKG